MDWLLQDIRSILSNLEIWVIYGGLISVGVTIFLIGLFKILIGNRIHNKLIRKTVLSFLSIIVVAPVTAIYLLTNTVHGIDYFWYLYAINAVGTVIVYWFYENTQIRTLFSLVGKTTVEKIFSAFISQDKSQQEVVKEIREDAKNRVKSYNEDDLTGL